MVIKTKDENKRTPLYILRNNQYICTMIKILLLSDLSREPARLLIKGISNFPNARGGWRFYQVPTVIRNNSAHISKIVSIVEEMQIDAIFGQWNGMDIRIAKQLGIPLVLYQRQDRVQGLPYVQCDNESVGRMAAEFFLRYKNIHFSFCGYKSVLWSKERLQSFKKHLRKAMEPEFLALDGAEDWDNLSEWVRKLPKPVGIFCCNDMNAKMLIETCLSIGLKIPDDVSILGVDNDSFICNTTSPNITTIKLDFEKVGYVVGEFINEAVETGTWSTEAIIHKPIAIVERESTLPLSTGDKYVNKIVGYMKENFRNGIDITDAIMDIPLTRRAIEQRFRKEYGDKTMHKILTELRINNMKKLLEETNLPVFNIALMSGFSENSNINRVFKSIVGLSPNQYRQTHKK